VSALPGRTLIGKRVRKISKHHFTKGSTLRTAGVGNPGQANYPNIGRKTSLRATLRDVWECCCAEIDSPRDNNIYQRKQVLPGPSGHRSII